MSDPLFLLFLGVACFGAGGGLGQRTERYLARRRQRRMNEDSMPSKRMVPEQRVFEVEERLVRLAAAKDAEIANWKREHDILDAFIEERLAEIAALTKERDVWKDQAMRSARATGELAQALDQRDTLTEQRDGYKRDYEDTRDCLNNERRIWTRINAGGATFAAERDEARAQIATLTEQRDRAMKLIEIARAYRGGTLDDALAAFDAEAAAKTEGNWMADDLPDADFWRAMHGAPRDGTEVRVRIRMLEVRAYWDEELRVFVLSRPIHIESIVDAFGWKPLASPSLPETP